MGFSAADIEALFPLGVRAAVEGTTEPTAEELTLSVGFAPVRREEFLQGRARARRALGALGTADTNVGRRRDRAPTWPAGVVGSISHCEGFCGAVVGQEHVYIALGLDVEPARALVDDVVRRICSREELLSFGWSKVLPERLWGVAAFCAKEAFYKAWYPVHGQVLDFDEAMVSFRAGAQSATGTFQLTARQPHVDAFARRVLGCWRADHGLFAAGAAVLA